MEAVNACLGGKLRPLKACAFSLLLVLARVGAEPLIVPLQADLFFLGQPLLLEHGDH